jgi:heptosyltransferase-2
MAMETIYSRLCAAVGVAASDGWPYLVVTADEEERARERKVALGIGVDEPLIGLAPGASFGGSKLWPVGHFADLADRLTAHYGWRTIIFGGPGEEAIVAALAAAMRSAPAAVGEPAELDLMKPFVRDLKLLITTDAGPRHFATAFRVPTAAVMGPTDPRWSGGHVDYQEVVRHDVECGPCHLQVCPIDHHCMVDITPDEVMARVADLERRCGPF